MNKIMKMINQIRVLNKVIFKKHTKCVKEKTKIQTKEKESPPNPKKMKIEKKYLKNSK
tara:strand:+ start:113 stop:286 length:174 start_codon:yes stop_codon:yes gene_type:complete